MQNWTLRRALVTVFLLGVVFHAAAHSAVAFQASESPDRIWRVLRNEDVSFRGTQIASLRNRPQVPEGARFVQLDQSRLRRALSRGTARLSTAARTNGFFEITLPMPDGTFVRFAVEEAPIMEPALAAELPDVRSFRGQAIDEPSMTVRFNQMSDGVYAIVIAPNRTFHIDPFPQRRGDTTTHVTFFRRDFKGADQGFGCRVPEDAQGPEILERRAARTAALTNGDTLRSYRLAMAATGEYTQFHGGTVDRALRAILNTLIRVNGIYERELAINMILVAGERRLIFTDPATDPYTNGDADAMLDENQRTIDDIISNANYDIGHVFGVGSGGVAVRRSMGQAGTKAMGVTGSSKPVGDPFDVDYVAHEMGHQFGANHTFNGTTGNCGGRNRNSTTAYEPGSGSTIMAYAGICGVGDLQANSDPFFHAASLEEIISYVTSSSVSAVPRMSPTNNHPPSVSGGDSFSVPRGTPFFLTAAGSDPDGDALTFSWEEFDLGTSSPPDDDVASLRPLFRVFSPEAEPVRIIPRLDRLVAGTFPGESLSSRNRVMTFRVTARDNRQGGGGIGFGTVSVTVNSDAGPFVVTQPTAAAIWQKGSTQTITWDVAGTSAAPLNTTHVKVTLSTDGGRTFNNVLADSIPNTGSATITVPSTPTAAARIKVEAVGGSYFNVSRGDFRIFD